MCHFCYIYIIRSSRMQLESTRYLPESKAKYLDKMQITQYSIPWLMVSNINQYKKDNYLQKPWGFEKNNS